jgi:hypothetical protein
MKSNLDVFRAQLDRNHATVVGLWKSRYRKGVMACTVLFACMVAFIAMYLVLGSERAGLVALVLAGLCIAQGWVLTREEHEWAMTLVQAGRCSSYVSLLGRHPAKTQAFQIRNRPLYMADFLALQDFVDALEEGSFERSEKDAAQWLEKGMPALAGAAQG